MRIHCLQHVPFSGRAYLPEWAAARGHDWSPTLVPQAARLPPIEAMDALIIMGGPMSLRDPERHPWLADERRLMAAALKSHIPVLGICLGAQILADILGATVRYGGHSEIGWYPIDVNPELDTTWLDGVLPDELESFFWHEDTFDLPAGAIRLASTQAFRNQGFVHGRHLALQFHLEVTPEWAAHLANRDAEQLVEAEFVQSAATILARPDRLYRKNNDAMQKLLDRWLAQDAVPG